MKVVSRVAWTAGKWAKMWDLTMGPGMVAKTAAMKAEQTADATVAEMVAQWDCVMADSMVASLDYEMVERMAASKAALTAV